jgi:uncharacterized protein with GYD domain
MDVPPLAAAGVRGHLLRKLHINEATDPSLPPYRAQAAWAMELPNSCTRLNRAVAPGLAVPSPIVLTVFLNRAYLGSGRVDPASRVHVQPISQRETEMPMFITYASYSHSGAKGLIEKPEDRSGAIKTLVEKAGGKLIAIYFTTGSNDVVLVSEVADGSDAVAVGMAVAASGSLSKIETVRAWTPSEFKGIAEKAAKVAGAYTPPGK